MWLKILYLLFCNEQNVNIFPDNLKVQIRNIISKDKIQMCAIISKNILLKNNINNLYIYIAYVTI